MKVSYSELLRELRGALNERRLKLVKLAFGKFDKNGNGEVDFKDMVQTKSAHATYKSYCIKSFHASNCFDQIVITVV